MPDAMRRWAAERAKQVFPLYVASPSAPGPPGVPNARTPEHALGGCFEGAAYVGRTTSSRTMTAFLRAAVLAAARLSTDELTFVLNQMLGLELPERLLRGGSARRVAWRWTGAASTCSTACDAPRSRRCTTSCRDRCGGRRAAQDSRSR